MKTKFFLAATAFMAAVLFLMCQEAATTDSEPEQSAIDPVERGSYLVNAIGCDDCHTPKKMGAMGPEPDMSRRFMGHPADAVLPDYELQWVSPGNWYLTNGDLTAWVGPWGISYSANISSDDTGIGTWTDEHFIRSIRDGIFKGIPGGRPLLPPMPWPTLRNFNDEDLKAIFAYLKTTAPMSNVVPPAELAGPPPQ